MRRGINHLLSQADFLGHGLFVHITRLLFRASGERYHASILIVLDMPSLRHPHL
jgi:hypothetical protein